MPLRIRAYGDTHPLNGAANKCLRRCPPAQWCCEYELTKTLARSMPLRIRAYGEAHPLNGAANTSLRRRPPAQWRCEYELTETPTCSMAPRIRAYGDAHLLNGAANKSLQRCLPAQCGEHRGCWDRLKAHPRRIPNPCPLLQYKNFCARISSRCSSIPNKRAAAPFLFPRRATAARRIRDDCATPPRRPRDRYATPPRRHRACTPQNPADKCSKHSIKG